MLCSRLSCDWLKKHMCAASQLGVCFVLLSPGALFFFLSRPWGVFYPAAGALSFKSLRSLCSLWLQTGPQARAEVCWTSGTTRTPPTSFFFFYRVFTTSSKLLQSVEEGGGAAWSTHYLPTYTCKQAELHYWLSPQAFLKYQQPYAFN